MTLLSQLQLIQSLHDLNSGHNPRIASSEGGNHRALERLDVDFVCQKQGLGSSLLQDAIR